MKKRLLSLMLIPVILLTFSSCLGNTEPEVTQTPVVGQPETNEPEASENANSDTTMFTDSAGREVEVPVSIDRIAASGYPAQIVLFSLAPDMLVGLAEEWTGSSEQFIASQYMSLPVLGSFYGSGDLNLEEVAVRDPQIIIDIGEAKSSIVEDMDGITDQVGIPTVHIGATFDTMPEAYRMLGKLLGKEAQAEELAKYCESVLSRTQELMNKIGGDGKRSLLYCMGGEGLNVIAEGTYHAQVIDRLSDNLAVIENATSKGTGNPVDMEQLMNWDPEVIIFAPDSIYKTVENNTTWQQLRAISNGQYFEVPEGPYSWMSFPPSVNRYMGMIWLAQLLYPETANYDMFEETLNYYKLFYHTDLTKEQFSMLTANSLK